MPDAPTPDMIRTEWAAIDATISRLTDEELERYAAGVLATLPEFIASHKSRRNPRTDRLLKSLIAEQAMLRQREGQFAMRCREARL